MSYSIQIESCNSFWFQSEADFNSVFKFEKHLKDDCSKVLERLSSDEAILIDQTIIVESSERNNKTYHRAKILSVNSKKRLYQV